MDLAYLRNDNETFAVYVERIGLFYVAGEDEDEKIAGAQPVVSVHRARLRGLKSGGRAAESLETENLEARSLKNSDRIGQGVGPGRVGLEEA
jgi:hypothetical protein